MTAPELRLSAAQGRGPPGETPALDALWHDARGDWESAHERAQADPGPDGSRVHAYLHRKQGDGPNARHWYARAGRDPAVGDSDAEWLAIAGELLARAR